MKRDMFNFAVRLEDVMDQLEKRNSNTYNMFCRLLHENNLNSLICEDQLIAAEIHEDVIKLQIDEGYVDFDLYHKLMRAARLLALARKKPQEIMPDEADFLSGCPMKYESFSDDDIAGISFDPNVEAVDDRTFYYIWLTIGDFEEITMGAKVDSERGTVHPLPFIPIKSKYDVNDYTNDKPLTEGERKTMIDRIFYTSLIPDEIIEGNNGEISWLDEDDEDNEWWDGDDIDENDECEDDEETEDEWEDDDDEDYDIEDDDFYEEDRKTLKDESEDIAEYEDDVDYSEELKKLLEREKEFNESLRDIKVLSITDLHGNDISGDETSMFPNIHANMKGFVGKSGKISIGERMYIFHQKPTLNPYCLNVRIHTSPVMFHSEELISGNEIKHIVRTVNSIYTFIEYKK